MNCIKKPISKYYNRIKENVLSDLKIRMCHFMFCVGKRTGSNTRHCCLHAHAIWNAFSYPPSLHTACLLSVLPKLVIMHEFVSTPHTAPRTHTRTGWHMHIHFDTDQLLIVSQIPLYVYFVGDILSVKNLIKLMKL